MIQPIGILDSGAGGLTVAKEIVKLLPFEDIIYFGDTFNCPYGDKSVEDIRALSSRIIKYFIEQNCKLIVVACNTVTVAGIDYLRSKFDIPLVGVVPVVKTAANLTKTGVFGVIATKFTIESDYHKKLIRKFAADKKVISQPCPGIVELIEKNSIEKNAVQIEKLLRKYLTPLFEAPPLESKIDVLALGCTHYAIVRDLIQKITGEDIHILDSGEAVACQVKRVLTNNSRLNGERSPVYKFCCSGPDENFGEIVKTIFKTEYKNRKADLRL
ncbi:MAG: glutamate racemase [bacterium]